MRIQISILRKYIIIGILSLIILVGILSPIISSLIPIQRNSLQGFSHLQKNTLANYTYIAYVCADNNLEPYGRADINKMEAGFNDSVTNVNVIALLDVLNGGTTAYYISHDNNLNTITSTQLVVPGLSSEVDMGDPNTLITFVEFCMTNYPAEHYVLDLWDHGSGWAVCYDQTSNDDALTMVKLRTALETINATMGHKIDVICMDACLMGTLEVAYEVSPYADVLIASEDTILATGYPYTSILTNLCANPGQSITEFSSKVVDLFQAYYSAFYQTTLSAVNLTLVDSAIFPNFAAFAQNLYGYLNFGIKNELYLARAASQEFYDPTFIDLYDFTQNTRNEASNTTIQTLAQNLMTNISATIINEKHHNEPGAHGLTIYFPATQSGYDSSYATYFSLANNTMWDEFLQKYYSSVSFGLGLGYYAVNETPNPGKTLLIEIRLENVGTQNAGSVNGTLVCHDTENVTVLSGITFYGDIAASHDATQSFSFTISNTCAIGQTLPFIIMTQGLFNTYTILRNFTFELIVGRQITLGGRDLARATEITAGMIYGILPGPGTKGVSWLKINCSKNYYLFLNLTAPELTDFDAYVYTATGALVSAAVKPNYPDECSLLVQQTGYYYIELNPYSGGNCYYDLFINMTTSPYEDGSCFGVAITLAPSTLTNNSLPGPGAYGYFFYRTILSQGQRLQVFLAGPYGVDFDLYIYDSNLRQVARSISPSASESCGLVASNSGYYYILIVPYSGAGAFTLELKTEGLQSFFWIIILVLAVTIASVLIGLALYFVLGRRSRNPVPAYHVSSNIRF